MAESLKALLADNVRYCKFYLQNFITDWGLCQKLCMAPYCKKIKVIMCLCVVLWRNGSICYCLRSFIMQWFPSVARLHEKFRTAKAVTLPQTETVFKGLKRAVDRWDKGSVINRHKMCSVCFNDCLFYW